ncbi:MAG: winged helix-turn-helix domain-containing protein [Candidatus ainarchaeum sp.]|nr:winged helix-turn-helix domain-containing protein [Candidatus ainarchaeum sp.]
MSKANDLVFVLRAKNRIKILEVLKDNKLISKQIEEKTGMYKSHVSRTLKELISKELVKCINPEDRNFRFYEITNKGKIIFNEILKIK